MLNVKTSTHSKKQFLFLNALYFSPKVCNSYHQTLFGAASKVKYLLACRLNWRRTTEMLSGERTLRASWWRRGWRTNRQFSSSQILRYAPLTQLENLVVASFLLKVIHITFKRPQFRGNICAIFKLKMIKMNSFKGIELWYLSHQWNVAFCLETLIVAPHTFEFDSL